MSTHGKGNFLPDVPTTAWEFYGLSRDVLGASGLHRLYGVEKSQVSRWCCNPDFTADTQRNPIDRLRMHFAVMAGQGHAGAVVAMLRELAEPLAGCLELRQRDEPQHACIRDELLDIPPAVAAHAQAIRMGWPLRGVEELQDHALREIRQATEAYRRAVRP